MRALIVAALVATAAIGFAGFSAPAAAAGHKVLVLPVDGSVDAATRGRLTADIARLARSLDGQISTGSATFADTALAVGCDPRAPGCSDEVMATLGVDELIWGTASRDAGQIRLVVHRAARGGAVREVTTSFPTGETRDRILAGITPVFGPPPAAPEPPPLPPAPSSGSSGPSGTSGSSPAAAGGATGSPAAPPPTTTTTNPPAAPTPGDVAAATADAPAAADAAPGPAVAREDRPERTLGIGLATGGGVSLVLGLALWASYSSLQDQIDSHPTRTLGDLQDLKSLEDSASNRAIAGDVFVVAGLVAGGLGAYYLVRDHRRHAVVVAPAPIAGGGGVTITLIGAP